MSIEVEVGQVWRHVHTKKDWKVIFVGRYAATLSDAEGTFTDSLWKFDKGIYSLVSDSPLSDLEIVQKALEKAECRLSIHVNGSWDVDDYTGRVLVSGIDQKALLTWAKQTIGGGVMDIERFDLFDCHGEYVGHRDVESIVAQRDELLAKLEDVSATIEGTVNLYKSLVKDSEEKLAAMETKAKQLITRACCNAVEKLTELAPNQGWDSGEVVAEMYIRQLSDKPVPAECVDAQESMVWLANALEQYAKGEVITVPSVTENEEEFFTWLKNQDLDSGAVSVDWPVVAHQYASKALSGLAAAPSHSQQSAWRPIETAPKDGTEVIVRFVLNEDGFVEAKNASFNRGWKRICHSTKSQQYFSFGKVTHWIPIPDLPGRCPSHESEQHNQQTEGK